MPAVDMGREEAEDVRTLWEGERGHTKDPRAASDSCLRCQYLSAESCWESPMKQGQRDSLLVTFWLSPGGTEMPEGRRLVSGRGRNPIIARTLGPPLS